jgi:enamine deaminase RidA (YjgF/YER057c/UK114 family)
MMHKRIRAFNTRDTYPEQNLDNDLAQAVVAGNTIYLRGQVPQDLDTSESIGIGDPVAQTHQVMQNIRQLIEECGGRMEYLTKLVVYLVDIRHREAVYRVMGEYIRGIHPVCTGLVVVALARPEWLVEIDAIAVIPSEASS